MPKCEPPQNRAKSFPRIHILTALDFGGSERQMLNLAYSYKDAGKVGEVCFVALAAKGRIGAVISELGFQVYALDLPPFVPNPKIVFRLKSIIREFRPNLIITNGTEANFHGIIAAKLSNVKLVIIEEIGIANYRLTAKLVLKCIYRFATFCFVGSNLVLENVIRQGILPPDKIALVHPPLGMRPKVNLVSKRNNLQFMSFLFVGRLEEVKGVSQLISALQILKEDYNLTNWNLIVVGDGSQESKLKLQSHESGLDGFIQFHSSTYLVQPFIDNCDFLVQPSVSEGMGYSMLEALVSGKPVVTTLVGVAPEVIQDGVNGYICSQLSIPFLAQKLRSCFNLNSEEYMKMCDFARSTDLSNFTIERYMANVECVI